MTFSAPGYCRALDHIFGHAIDQDWDQHDMHMVRHDAVRQQVILGPVMVIQIPAHHRRDIAVGQPFHGLCVCGARGSRAFESPKSTTMHASCVHHEIVRKPTRSGDLVRLQGLILGVARRSESRQDFRISAWPKLLASFATPKLSLEDALVVQRAVATCCHDISCSHFTAETQSPPPSRG